jgi:phage tail sheath protein FI
MATAIKTPGVYINELNAFPNSVVEVPTAIPAFFGYTEKGPSTPKRISSMKEFIDTFGGPPQTQFVFTDLTTPLKVEDKSRFLLYYSMRLFFDNGGGPCWIVSVGTYGAAITAGKSTSDFTNALPQLEKNLEATILLAPDAVLLNEDGWQTVCQAFLAHCHKMQSRVSILDVFGGSVGRTYDANDVVNRFRNRIASDFLNYGQAYYPWVNTSIVDVTDVDYSAITDASLTGLQKVLTDAIAAVPDPAKSNLTTLIGQMSAALQAERAKRAGTTPATTGAAPAAGTPVPPNLTQIHRSLVAVSPVYVQIMKDIRKQLNLLPPSGGMAGVYTRIDNAIGVFKAPANTTINSVVSPAVDLTDTDQEDLNVPLDGKAINAIRIFPGRGLLVWGARTLDGNSQDWRYINVRRTIIMLEQSIKYATLAYVFEPNTAPTWVTVRNMITNFLTNQWKSGALAGTKPEDAFSVDVGLGSTMTADDILDGFMYVTVKVALVHPAEFIVITFQQKMQTS